MIAVQSTNTCSCSMPSALVPFPSFASRSEHRRQLSRSAVPTEPFVFAIRGWGAFEVFLNGVAAVKKFDSTGRIQIGVAQSVTTKALRVGRNVIAVHGTQLRLDELAHFALYQFPATPGR
jgi:hypothetical protein